MKIETAILNPIRKLEEKKKITAKRFVAGCAVNSAVNYTHKHSPSNVKRKNDCHMQHCLHLHTLCCYYHRTPSKTRKLLLLAESELNEIYVEQVAFNTNNLCVMCVS